VQPHAETLARQGYEVVVISPNGWGTPAHVVVNGVNVYRFPLRFAGKTWLSYFREFLTATFFISVLTIWVWIRHGMDVLLMYNPPDSLFFAALLPKLAGKKIVFDVRDLSPELYESKFLRPSPLLKRWLSLMERWSCNISDYVTAVNQSYRSILVERDGVPEERISVIRQGPDMEEIAHVTPDPEARTHGKILIAYLGNMARERGTGNLLRSLYHLEHDFGYQDWCCVLIGSPDPSQSLEDMADELGIRDRLWFPGYLPNEKWMSIIAAVDICVDPGPVNSINRISTTNKMMNYMALAKPVVVFDMPERRYTGEDTVLYAKENDDIDFARQIALLISDPDLRRDLGEKGRKRIESQLALSYQRDLLIHLYTRVICPLQPEPIL
jgi:glycosyltransferase involved in cell wall biosynthesis